jgi:DNA-binding LacI/PurR family transcriptional regulator
VSVAGFDDVPVAALTSPSLSTVRLPLREMGRRGFAEAARVLVGDELTPAVLPTELAMRASTSSPPAAALP